jgi:hypothetical protein
MGLSWVVTLVRAANIVYCSTQSNNGGMRTEELDEEKPPEFWLEVRDHWEPKFLDQRPRGVPVPSGLILLMCCQLVTGDDDGHRRGVPDSVEHPQHRGGHDHGVVLTFPAWVFHV